MPIWWIIYLAVLVAAALLAAGLTYVWRGIGLLAAFTDQPASQPHKGHDRPTPVLGGAAMLTAWIAMVGGGFAIASLTAPWLGDEVAVHIGNLTQVLPQLGVIVGGGLCLALVGFVDDWRPLPPGVKLLAQICAAALVAAFGVRVKLFFTHPLLTWGLTTFWLLFIINAINFFDNMDGLAGGVAAIASLVFMVVAGLRGQHYVAVLAASVAGVSSGFLVFNWPPASIFMGDCGSHLLGYLLAVLGGLTTFYLPGETPTYAPLLIPLLVLILPIFDTCAVVLIRLRLGHPVYRGDHRHLSHRFQQLGLSRRCSVILIHLLGLALGAGALLLLWLPPFGAVVVFAQTIFILTFISILHLKGKKP